MSAAFDAVAVSVALKSERSLNEGSCPLLRCAWFARDETTFVLYSTENRDIEKTKQESSVKSRWSKWDEILLALL
jgi:hypothetical protein